mmetsp:Transcript_59599/g.141039  ORF Transcript_59599/g.141039 Transcript_59599/m.141039 type:complete len:251 (-) Transcript_59599:1-753(-)
MGGELEELFEWIRSMSTSSPCSSRSRIRLKVRVYVSMSTDSASSVFTAASSSPVRSTTRSLRTDTLDARTASRSVATSRSLSIATCASVYRVSNWAASASALRACASRASAAPSASFTIFSSCDSRAVKRSASCDRSSARRSTWPVNARMLERRSRWTCRSPCLSSVSASASASATSVCLRRASRTDCSSLSPAASASNSSSLQRSSSSLRRASSSISLASRAATASKWLSVNAWNPSAFATMPLLTSAF